MKRSLTYFLLAFVAMSFYACSEDELSSVSVIKVEQGKKNDFDKWLQIKYTDTYNIDFKYRLEDNESDMNYYLVPADYNKSIQMAHLVKHLCLDAFDEVVGSAFTKSYFPKMINLVGSAAYNTNGTIVLGTAQGGLKITLYMINKLEPTNVPLLNEYYFKTIHHEFTHILNQTKPFSTDFKMISGKDYVNDSWNTSFKKDSLSLKKGFITPYASKEDNEDFVELVAVYLTHTEQYWQEQLAIANRDENGLPYKDANGKPINGPGYNAIKAKFEIVSNYMKNVWGFNISDLRDVIQRRSGEVLTLNLDELKID